MPGPLPRGRRSAAEASASLLIPGYRANRKELSVAVWKLFGDASKPDRDRRREDLQPETGSAARRHENRAPGLASAFSVRAYGCGVPVLRSAPRLARLGKFGSRRPASYSSTPVCAVPPILPRLSFPRLLPRALPVLLMLLAPRPDSRSDRCRPSTARRSREVPAAHQLLRN